MSELLQVRPIELATDLRVGDYALFQWVDEPDERDPQGNRGAGLVQMKSVTVRELGRDGTPVLQFAVHYPNGDTVEEGNPVALAKRPTVEEMVTRRWLLGVEFPPGTKFHASKTRYELATDDGALEAIPCERIDVLTPDGFRTTFWLSAEVPGGVARVSWRTALALHPSGVQLIGLRTGARMWGKPKPDR